MDNQIPLGQSHATMQSMLHPLSFNTSTIGADSTITVDKFLQDMEEALATLKKPEPRPGFLLLPEGTTEYKVYKIPANLLPQNIRSTK